MGTSISPPPPQPVIAMHWRGMTENLKMWLLILTTRAPVRANKELLRS